MTSSPFESLNFKIDVSPIASELHQYNWVATDHNMPSARLPESVERELLALFNFPVNDVYVVAHNLKPIQNLPSAEVPYLTTWHVDDHRAGAILIPISPDNPNHYTEFYVDRKVVRVPYTQGVPMLFNVKAPHKVTNCDPTLTRNIIAIGLKTTSFEALLEQHKQGNLINHAAFKDSLFTTQLLFDSRSSVVLV